MKYSLSGIALLFATAALSLSSCNGLDVADVYSPAALRKMLQDAGGWVMLPFPESKFAPGSIIKVTEEGGIVWLDHLETCEYSAEVLEPVKSTIPSIQFTKAVELGASAVVDIHGIEAGPEFADVSKTRLTIQDHGTDTIRLIKLRIWSEEPANQAIVKPHCMEELLKPDTYLVTEGFRVSKGKYTLLDSTGVAIKLNAPAVLSSVLKIQPDVKYEVTADGSLIIEAPVYFAVRRAMRVGADWETLGAPESDGSADALIDEAFRKEHEL